MTTAPHVLYRMFNQSGRLLYVGITNNPKGRFRSHSKEKTWWQEVANITLQHHATREDLAFAECRAIQKETPLYNIALQAVPQPTAPQPAKCPTCASPEPGRMPVGEEELLMEDGSLTPWCTDPYHFPDDPKRAAELHEDRDLLRKSKLLMWSAEAEIRRARQRKAMESLGDLLSWPSSRETAS